jgi:ribonuclease P protein component
VAGEGFPRSARLLRPPEFRNVFDRGRSHSDRWLIVYALDRGDGAAPRLGLVVGRKYGNAVCRSAFRRRMREAFRKRRAELPAGHDLVVLPVVPGELPAATEAERSLAFVAAKAAESFRRRGPR